MPNKLLVRNPALNEFIYSIFYNITAEQKKKLSKPFLFVAKSEMKAKNFAEFSTLDEKVRLLSELGYENAIVFFQDKFKTNNALKVILEKYNKDKVVSAAKDIVDLGIFVSSDKQVKYLLMLMADTISHKSYFLNSELSRVGYHIKNWKPQRDNPAKLQLDEAIGGLDLTVLTILNSCNLLSQVDSISGVSQYQMKILLYLYRYKHTFISKQRIWDFFAGDFTKGKCTTALKGLYENKLVRKPANLAREYTLTSEGIEAVNAFVNRVLKQNY